MKNYDPERSPAMAVLIPIKRPFADMFLLAYSGEHLAYEIDMFFGMGELRRHPSFPFIQSSVVDSTKINNALIESFVVHVRNIIDFFYPNRVADTDVVASDFFDSEGWENIRPILSDILDKARKRAHKELAHLTTARINGALPEKTWAFDNLANELRPILRLFVENAKASRLSALVAATIR